MYIFLGLIYSSDDETRVRAKSKSGMQMAANKYQWGILNGLQDVLAEEILVLNSVPMGSYPKHCKILREKEREVMVGRMVLRNLGFLNIPIIKQLQRQYNAYIHLKKILKNTKEPVTVVLYSLYRPYMKTMKSLKRKFKNFKYTLIVPDLPLQYGIENNNILIRMLQRIIGKSVLKLSKYADNYVLLTEQMKEPLKIEKKQSVVIEGIVECNINETIDCCREEIPVILYTGTLDRALGIANLIEAFERLPKSSAQLWIAGSGDYQLEVENKSRENTNIKYFGFCSQQEVREIQKEAFILVNPRSANDEYTKYSFPSKTMEYLMAGKPVAMHRLPGIPHEYDPFLFFFEGESPAEMASTLCYLLEKDKAEIVEHCQKAFEFIQTTKNARIQALKLVELNNEE